MTVLQGNSCAWMALAAVLCGSCGGTMTGSDAATGDAATTGDAPAASQTPPMGAAAVEAWLATGAYRAWHCETALHTARAPSPHGFNRICSNDLIANAATGTTDWPVGAAAVKELYASETATTPSGYAVYLNTADTAGGDGWYWYERVPLDSPVPHDAMGVVADGLGSAGTAMTICVGCHAGAGTDMAHTPSMGGRDQVYTPVR